MKQIGKSISLEHLLIIISQLFYNKEVLYQFNYIRLYYTNSVNYIIIIILKK